MSNLIESLESRRLLSASPVAVTTLFGQGRVVDADGKEVARLDVADLKLIGANLKAAKLLKVDKVAIKTLSRGDAAAAKVFANGIKVVDKVIVNDTKSLESAGNALARKPTNARLIAAVAARKTTLSTQSAKALSALTNDGSVFQTTDATDSSALSTANPTVTALGMAVMDYQTSLSSSLSLLQAAITTALTTDVANVLALY